MDPRLLAKKLRSASKAFPVVVITGPRQSGKTTLVQSVFPKKPYVNFEDLDTREYVRTDPRRFLSQYDGGAVFDEVQRVPEILSYLQGIVDARKKAGLLSARLMSIDQ